MTIVVRANADPKQLEHLNSVWGFLKYTVTVNFWTTNSEIAQVLGLVRWRLGLDYQVKWGQAVPASGGCELWSKGRIFVLPRRKNCSPFCMNFSHYGHCCVSPTWNLRQTQEVWRILLLECTYFFTVVKKKFLWSVEPILCNVPGICISGSDNSYSLLSHPAIAETSSQVFERWSDKLSL